MSLCEKLKRQRDEPAGSYGGAPLSVATRKSTVYLYYKILLTPEEIAPLILSPRKASYGAGVRTAHDVLTFFEVFHHVEGVLHAPRALKIPEAHIDMLIEIVTRTPWLYLGEGSAELDTRCRVQYLPGCCCAMLNAAATRSR